MAYLASEEAALINGASIDIDGGYKRVINDGIDTSPRPARFAPPGRMLAG